MSHEKILNKTKYILYCVFDLHSVVLGGVVSNGLQEWLGVIAKGDSSAVELGFVWCGGPW